MYQNTYFCFVQGGELQIIWIEMRGLVTGTAAGGFEHDFVFAHRIDIEPDSLARKCGGPAGKVPGYGFLFATLAIIRSALLFDFNRGDRDGGFVLHIDLDALVVIRAEIGKVVRRYTRTGEGEGWIVYQLSHLEPAPNSLATKRRIP